MRHAMLVALLVLAACGPKVRPAQPVAVRAADIEVPGPPDAVSLGLPATPYAAFNAFVTLLDAVGVRYGIEGPASDPAAPPVDLARGRDSVLLLGGRPLGDALDAIVKAVPQYRWSDAGGFIVIRASADGDGILDRHVSRFRLARASPRTALDVLAGALDPARPRGVGVVETSRAGQPRPIRPVTLSLRDTTAQAVLVAVAKAHGDLSWTVRYDRAPASVETATIAVVAPGTIVRAASAELLRRRADPTDAWRRLTIGSSFADLLFSYAERAEVRINVEEAVSDIARTITSQLAIGMPPLELDDDPARSVARIVALDSRYEWSESGGRFLVRPRPGVPGRWDLLDRTLDGFRSIEEPAAAAIERIARVLGPTRQGGGSVTGLAPTAAADALAKRITVDLSGTVTIRDALNAVADATGWMWSARPMLPPGRPAMLAIGWRGRVEPSGAAGRGRSSGPPAGTVGTWTRMFTITLPEHLAPATAASRAPAPARGPGIHLDLPVTGASLRRALGLVARAHDAVFGLEIVAGTPGTPVGRSPASLDLTGLTIEEALSIVEALTPDYVTSVDNGVYHVRPRADQRDSTPWLTRRVERFDRAFDSLQQAMSDVAALAWSWQPPAGQRPPVSGRPPPAPTRLVLSLAGVTVRDILDEIALQSGAAQWVVEQRVASSGPLVRLTFLGDGWSLTTTVR
jgi:hypothetical protein